MSVDMFLEIKGVDGQTQDKEHKAKKLIDIQGWSFGCSNSGNLHSGTGGSGKVSYTDIQINSQCVLHPLNYSSTVILVKF